MPIVLHPPRPGLAESEDQKAALLYALCSRIFSVSLALLGKLVPSPLGSSGVNQAFAASSDKLNRENILTNKLLVTLNEK